MLAAVAKKSPGHGLKVLSFRAANERFVRIFAPFSG